MRLSLFFFLLLSSLFLKSKADTLNYSSTIEIVDSVSAKELVIKHRINKATRLKEGIYTMTYKQKLLISGSYVNDKRNGLWKFYRMNDTVQVEGNYKNGNKDGEWRSYYPDGKLSCIMRYNNGKLEKASVGYYPNGNISFQKTYEMDTLIGEVKYLYPDGKVWYTEVYKNGLLNGPSKTYYENGVLKEEVTFKQGRRDSIYKYYYDNGTLWEHIIYKNGGIWNVIAYNDSIGKPINCCTIKDGNGIMRFFDKDGKVSQESEYKNLQRDGKYTYYKKGKIDEEGNYKSGEKDGLWKSYRESGELYSDINYVSDEKNGSAVYYKAGKIKEKGMYKDGQKEGIWINYDEQGNTLSEYNYIKGQIDGETKLYTDGSLASSGKTINGTKVGNWNFYKKNGKVDRTINFAEPKAPIYKGTDIINNKDTQIEKAQEIYTITEIMPSFPGGEQGMISFIQKNIYYPMYPKENGIQGTVYISLVVSATGEVIEAKILRGAQVDLDEESLRLINAMPLWNVGMQCGRPVSVQYNLPIRYTLR